VTKKHLKNLRPCEKNCHKILLHDSKIRAPKLRVSFLFCIDLGAGPLYAFECNEKENKRFKSFKGFT
jgi:hypothetical protein